MQRFRFSVSPRLAWGLLFLINKTCVEGMARVYGVTYEDFLKFLTEADFSIEKLFKLPTAEKEQSDPALSESGANKMKKLKIGLSVTVAAAVSSACALIVLCVAFYRHLEGNAAAGANVNFSHWFLLFVIAVLIAAAPAACVFGAWIIKEKIKNKKDKR